MGELALFSMRRMDVGSVFRFVRRTILCEISFLERKHFDLVIAFCLYDENQHENNLKAFKNLENYAIQQIRVYLVLYTSAAPSPL